MLAGLGDDDLAERLIDRGERVPSSTIPEAEALACTCSGRLAPTIADARLPWRSTHANAICAIVSPARSATGFSR